MPNNVQIGVVGAMQRAHPALTELWLQWTGVPHLERCTFDLRRDEKNVPVTSVKIPALLATSTWPAFCDLLQAEEDSNERNQMPVELTAKNPAHDTFWSALRRRERDEVDGPLEWWWHLMQLRYKGIHKASRALLHELTDDRDVLFRGLVHFVNPSLQPGHRARQILRSGTYRQPTHMNVVLRAPRKSAVEGFTFDLANAPFKGKVVSTLLNLSTARL